MSFRSPRIYHQGWVCVKQTEAYSYYYAQLRAGKVLNFYQDETKSAGSGKHYQSSISLDGLADVQSQYDRRPGIGRPMFVIILKFDSLHSRFIDVKLRVSTVEERSAWIRYIRAVGLGRLPDQSEHLLPGQIQQLEDVIQHEQLMDQNFDYEKMNGVDDSVTWYYPEIKHRKDAEEILSNSTNEGNLLVRMRSIDPENPADDWNYAVSAMSRVNGQCTFHHFRLKWSEQYNTFEIGLTDGPHPQLMTLDEVVTFFENRSNCRYRRLSARIALPSNAYQQVIFPATSDTQVLYVNDPYNAKKSKR